MATTNTNTDGSVLSTDIYDIAGFIDDIRTHNIPNLDGTAAMVGIFGYITEVASQSLQNTLIAVSETSNEAIATRAKFSKNILAHAMNLAITDINAKPAVMTMMIYLPLKHLEANYQDINSVTGKATFILSRECPIAIEDYEYHLDYDVIITRVKNSSNKYVYTAMYDLFDNGTTHIKQVNPVSDISNPYITTLIQTTLEGTDCIAFSARLHQVTLDVVEKQILTDNDIENKTVTFDFADQLAAFDIDVIEPNGYKKHLTPIYSGLLDYTVEDGEWCYYEYLNEHTIRVLFSRDSYVPALGSTVRVNVQLSEGSNANLPYTENFRTGLLSETYNNYNGMYAIIYPLMNGIATSGKDKKSIAELKKIIPREASSRGSIINTTDLNNFFNSINSENSFMYFFKKKDNPFERLYYSYLITKKNSTVYPTNTVSLELDQSDFKGFAGNNNLVLPPGTKFYYWTHGSNKSGDYATLTPPVYVDGLDTIEYPYNMTINEDGELVRVYEYITPFLITVDDDLISTYLLTLMNENKTFKFESINNESNIQFIATNMNWRRRYIYTDNEGNTCTYDNKYTMDIDILQNSNLDTYELIKMETDGNGDQYIADIRVKIIMVLYADSKGVNPYRYIEAEPVAYDSSNNIYSFRITLESDDMMDLSNRINITGIYNVKPEALQTKAQLKLSHGYMEHNTFAKIFILADFGKKAGDLNSDGTEITIENETIELFGEDGIGNRSEIESIVPVKADIIERYLKGEIEAEVDNTIYNVVSVMRSNDAYMANVYAYNGDETNTQASILRYLRNNITSDFVQNILLQDSLSIAIIDSFNYLDLDRYTVCNVLSVDGGLDFYHDYSSMMTSVVNVAQVQETNNGEPVYKEIVRTDSLGNKYSEFKPVYKLNENGGYYYHYTIDRIPMVKSGFLSSETSMQQFIYDLEERRRYMLECMYILEDTFGIDFKFVNTYGPARRFFYRLPGQTSFKAKAAVSKVYVYRDTSTDAVVGSINLNEEFTVVRTTGIWAYIDKPYSGYVRLSDIARKVNYLDNVAIRMKFALEAESSADKYITRYIIDDIKAYIENINSINEIHIPNIITLITNNYREQIKYFEFVDVNGYGSGCQHLYYDDNIDPDEVPEFINVEVIDDLTMDPNIDITVY